MGKLKHAVTLVLKTEAETCWSSRTEAVKPIELYSEKIVLLLENTVEDDSQTIDTQSDGQQICTNDKPPQRGGAVPFPPLGRVEMACQFPEGLILGRFSLGQLFSFFIPAVQCAVTCGQHS